MVARRAPHRLSRQRTRTSGARREHLCARRLDRRGSKPLQPPSTGARRDALLAAEWQRASFHEQSERCDGDLSYERRRLQPAAGDEIAARTVGHRGLRWLAIWTAPGLLGAAQSYLANRAIGEDVGLTVPIAWNVPVWYFWGTVFPLIRRLVQRFPLTGA